MQLKKSRNEINLRRLLSRCQEMANSSPHLAQEWRLPKFLAAADVMFSSLPLPPDTMAPSNDDRLNYLNSLQFLHTICQQIPDNADAPGQVDEVAVERVKAVRVTLPHGPAMTRDTVTKQIYQRTTERAHLSQREQLFGSSCGSNSNSLDPDAQLDSLLAAHREQQERVAEEMLGLTSRLKEQSLAARSIVQEDVARLERTNRKADENLAKLETEGDRISKLASKWNCRCWIWLAMVIVVLTFVGMVLLMRLFKKSVPAPLDTPPSPSPAHYPPVERVEL